MAGVSQQTTGGYLVRLSETELALIKTALEHTARITRFGMEVLDKADHDTHGKHAENPRLRQEIEALARREASLRSLHETWQGPSEATRQPSRTAHALPC